MHISIWHRGEPVFIDPGTGAYHADRKLRDYLASWQAHNGPRPLNPTFPERRGAFLWSAHHATPRWEKLSDLSLRAELALPSGTMRRTITRLESQDGWQFEDGFYPAAQQEPGGTAVFWQLAPNVQLHRAGDQALEIELRQSRISIEWDDHWQKAELPSARANPAYSRELRELRGFCSSAFRRVEWGPFVSLEAAGTTPSAGLRTVVRSA